jgi:hypothetical protein
LTCEEEEDITPGLRKMNLKNGCDCCTKIVRFGLRRIMYVNGKTTSGDVKNGGIVEVFLGGVREETFSFTSAGLTEKACALRVAELIMTRISGRALAMSLTRGMRMSVLTLRSCASSMTMAV